MTAMQIVIIPLEAISVPVRQDMLEMELPA